MSAGPEDEPGIFDGEIRIGCVEGIEDKFFAGLKPPLDESNFAGRGLFRDSKLHNDDSQTVVVNSKELAKRGEAMEEFGERFGKIINYYFKITVYLMPSPETSLFSDEAIDLFNEEEINPV